MSSDEEDAQFVSYESFAQGDKTEQEERKEQEVLKRKEDKETGSGTGGVRSQGNQERQKG